MYLEEWNAIAARIDGLTRAGGLAAQLFGAHGSDPFGGEIWIRQQLYDVLVTVSTFKQAHRHALPSKVVERIEAFDTSVRQNLEDQSGMNREVQARSCLIRFAAFQSEIGYFFKDLQTQIRARSERAFLHLQQSLAADDGVREKWQSALSNGEVACEKLGAAHLLSHGIYAFKVDATGARTDLIFHEALEFGEIQQRAVEGLVLTEWKVARAGNRVVDLYNHARRQTDAYSAGPLAGVELKNYRYIVVVSSDHLKALEDENEGGITFRFVNIVVNPKAPSRRVSQDTVGK